MNADEAKYGCPVCWPADESAAYQNLPKLKIDDYLVDESHYIVALRSCESCGQPYVSVTTETIDWEGGEDPIYRTLLPITKAEATALLQVGSAIKESNLNGLGVGRKSLRFEWPKDQPQKSYWSTGILVGPHD